MSQDQSQKEPKDEQPEEEVQPEEPKAEAVAEEEPQPEETILTREELMQDYKDKAPSRVVHGFRVRGLSGIEQQRVDAARLTAIGEAKPAERLAEGRIAQMVQQLRYGVIKPVMKDVEWRYALGQPGRAGQFRDVVAAIQELSGVLDPEVELAKKVLEEMELTSEGST